MITIEKIIPYVKKISVDKLQRKTLDELDDIDNQTDLNISKKLVDENGNTVMLIECIPSNIFYNDVEKSDKGCFIRRFEFTENLTDIRVWEKFFSGLLTEVKFSMILCENEGFVSCYKYIWIEVYQNEETIIQDLPVFKMIREDQGKVIYGYRWSQD